MERKESWTFKSGELEGPERNKWGWEENKGRFRGSRSGWDLSKKKEGGGGIHRTTF